TDAEYEQVTETYAELDRGQVHTRATWVRRQDGSGFWCRVTGRAVQAGDRAKGYVWLLEDITERKRADEALHRLLREQDAVLENALAGIIFVRDRRIVRCNRRFEQIFGYDAGELINQSTRFMFASDDEYDAGGEAVYQTVWEGETLQLRRQHLRKDGALIWCSISGRAVQSGDPSQGSVWLFEDITQQHEAEERIERALAEQELILDNATVGIAFIRNRTYQRCNPRFEQMFGYGPAELIGQSTRAIYCASEEYERDGAWYDEMRDGRSV